MFSGLGAIIGANEDLLHRMSLTDPLTGLPNRRHFDKRVREELARVDRYHYPLTLMVIDLDGLKTLNDRLGHEGGDNALRAVARSLQQTCRATDLAARIGGDEFAVLATNIHLTEAIALAERIRNTVQTEASLAVVGAASADAVRRHRRHELQSPSSIQTGCTRRRTGRCIPRSTRVRTAWRWLPCCRNGSKRRTRSLRARPHNPFQRRLVNMRAYLESRVEIVRADITTLDLDAIVNAANSSLFGWRRG